MTQSIRLTGALLGSLALTLLAGCSGGGMGKGGEASGEAEHPLLGAKAPDFNLKAQYGGSEASLSAVAGKVVIVDFWATWCDPCKESFPHYQAMLDRHAGDLAVIGVSVDDEPDGIAAFGQQTGVKFPLAWDDGQSVSRQYSPSTMPTSFVIDRNGIVRYVHAGFHSGDEAELEQRVSAIK
ncbi:MAG: TlpA disulfide reductase family protein [Polyangiaceae bacterium]